jgi:hypothetical protein
MDKVVRDGRVVDPNGGARVEDVRRMMDAIKADARLTVAAVQAVGVKGCHAFLMAVVR